MTPESFKSVMDATNTSVLKLEALHAAARDCGSTWSVEQLHLLLSCLEDWKVSKPVGEWIVQRAGRSREEELEDAIGAAAGTRAAGTIAGAAIGGMLGNRVGAAMDDEDKRRAYAAQVQALESGPSGAPVAWRNPDSGRYGSIVPGPASEQNGMNCRQYTHTIYIDGKPQTARGAACRNPDGSWQPV